tara:strand:- start:8514 stop:9110 length:597 start_codon:yes stop_codon:yes gene_type:complete
MLYIPKLKLVSFLLTFEFSTEIPRLQNGNFQYRNTLNSTIKQKKSMKINTLTISLLFATQIILAQKTIPASGGEAQGNGGSSSYTVGQIVYTTNGTMSQGVQQPYEFQTLSNPLLTSVHLIASTYPNPTSESITLKISDSTLKNLSYILFDLNGRSIATGDITNPSTQIKMKPAAIGVYVLKIIQKQQTIKIFKIIKK